MDQNGAIQKKLLVYFEWLWIEFPYSVSGEMLTIWQPEYFQHWAEKDHGHDI